MSRDVFFDPNKLDGGLTDHDLAQAHDNRTIASVIGGIGNGDENRETPEEKELCQRTDDAITNISERGAHERNQLPDKQEEGAAFIGPRKTVQGTVWKNGKLVDRPWHEHPDWVKSALRQNEEVKRVKKFAAATRQLFGGPKAKFDDEGTPLTPDEKAPDFQVITQAKAAPVVTAKSRRISKEQRIEGLKRLQLDRIRDAIRARLADRPTPQRDADIGIKLEEAHALVARGGWDEWVEKSLGMSRRSSFYYRGKTKQCKKYSLDKSTA